MKQLLRRTGERPLPSAVRSRMEAAFGTDFSEVRVREDDAAAAMHAAAFTRGSEIAFHPGVWDPSTRDGLEALGHELAHVLQQRAGRVPGTGVTEDPALEAEAHEAAARIGRGEPATQVVSGRGSGGAAPAAATAGPAPAQPGRFGDLFRGLLGRDRPEEQQPEPVHQQIPPDLQVRDTPYQPIPALLTTRGRGQGTPWSQMESPYATLPAFGGDLLANTPQQPVRYPQQPPPRPPVKNLRFLPSLERGPSGSGQPVADPKRLRGILHKGPPKAR